MYITGYHGTSLDAARSIINSEQFIRSDGPTHWLGNGIYFYADFEDAYNWRYDDSSPLPEAIVHTIIRVEEDKYLDLNSIEGQKLFADVGILLRRSGRIKAQAKFTQENQCSICNMLWDVSPNLQVITALLPKHPSAFHSMIDTRPRRREICVRDNSSIIYRSLIVRGDLHD